MTDKLIYINYGNGNVSEKDIRENFGKYGNIVHINPKNGFGFVEYENGKDAEDAVHEMNGTEIKGVKIKVEKAKGPRQNRESTRRSDYRITVENLPSSLDWYKLKDHFKQVGEVLFADVIKDSQGRTKNYGIVEFKYKDEMEKAISKLNDSEFEGTKITVKEDTNPRRPRSSQNRSRRYSPYSRRRSSSRRRSHSPRRRSPRRSRSPRRNSSRDRYRKRSASGSPAPRKSRRSPSRSPSPVKKSKRYDSPKKSSPKRSRHSPSPKAKRSPRRSNSRSRRSHS